MIATQPKTIVAELSKGWIDGEHACPANKLFIGQMFEQAIAVNEGRGYRLASWALHRTSAVSQGAIYCSETIVAVFELKERG